MIKTIANKFRGHFGSVHQGVSGNSGTDVKKERINREKDRLPDCAYLLHAGIASARRHSTRSA
ncbi:MAG: hypothetical protein R3318_01695 [Gammaproteobacteria bacterium]|nr:hypothetical protein [Gammaproteobacteria bacterium]